jgi:hypothetical protein
MSSAPKVLNVQYNASPTLNRFHYSKAVVRGIMGPVGSGKSTGCCMELFQIACNQRPNHKGIRRTRMIVVRNTMPELKSTTIKTWQDWFPPGNPKKDPTTFGEFTGVAPLTHYVEYGLDDGTRVDMEVIFLALDKADDVKKLLSLECTAVWINEAREVPREIVDGATTRIGRFPSARDGGCTRKAVILDTNPPDDEHWWHEWAEEDTPEGYEFFRQPGGLDDDAENLEWLEQPENWRELTLEERRAHGRKYYTDMVRGKTPEYVDVMVNANYGVIVNGVPVFAKKWNKRIHQSPTVIPIRSRVPVTVGIDCSGRHPALVYLQPVARMRWQVVRELCVMDEKGMGAEAFAKYFVDDIKKHFPDSPIDEIWGDPAGDSPSQNDDRTYFDILNKELKKYRLKAKAAVDALRFPDRYDAVCWMLSELVDGEPMLEVSPECKVLIQGMEGKYKFKQINTAGGGTITDDRPIKNIFSNVQDGLQYAACGIRYRSKLAQKGRGAKPIYNLGTGGKVI